MSFISGALACRLCWGEFSSVRAGCKGGGAGGRQRAALSPPAFSGRNECCKDTPYLTTRSAPERRGDGAARHAPPTSDLNLAVCASAPQQRGARQRAEQHH